MCMKRQIGKGREGGSKQTMRSLDNITKTKGDDRNRHRNKTEKKVLQVIYQIKNAEKDREKQYEYRSVSFAGWTGN